MDAQQYRGHASHTGRRTVIIVAAETCASVGMRPAGRRLCYLLVRRRRTRVGPVRLRRGVGGEVFFPGNRQPAVSLLVGRVCHHQWMERLLRQVSKPISDLAILTGVAYS